MSSAKRRDARRVRYDALCLVSASTGRRFAYRFSFVLGGNPGSRTIYNPVPGQAMAYIELKNQISRTQPGLSLIRIKLVNAWEETNG